MSATGLIALGALALLGIGGYMLFTRFAEKRDVIVDQAGTAVAGGLARGIDTVADGAKTALIDGVRGGIDSVVNRLFGGVRNSGIVAPVLGAPLDDATKAANVLTGIGSMATGIASAAKTIFDIAKGFGGSGGESSGDTIFPSFPDSSTIYTGD